jgi:hypothetical protein
VRQLAIALIQAPANNVFRAFRLRDLVGRGEPTASALEWGLAFFLAACFLPFLFRPQGIRLIDLRRC